MVQTEIEERSLQNNLRQANRPSGNHDLCKKQFSVVHGPVSTLKLGQCRTNQLNVRMIFPVRSPNTVPDNSGFFYRHNPAKPDKL
jgi:hypothetical protein